jgi:hypothetical protein
MKDLAFWLVKSGIGLAAKAEQAACQKVKYLKACDFLAHGGA